MYMHAIKSTFSLPVLTTMTTDICSPGGGGGRSQIHTNICPYCAQKKPLFGSLNMVKNKGLDIEAPSKCLEHFSPLFGLVPISDYSTMVNQN